MKELGSFTEMAKTILVQNEENTKAIAGVVKTMEENHANIIRLDKKSVELQDELAIVQDKISEFAVIKQVLKVFTPKYHFH